jgi:hypothetical protein
MMNLSLYLLVLRLGEVAYYLEKLTLSDDDDDDGGGEYYPTDNPSNDPDPDSAIEWQDDSLYLEFADIVRKKAQSN